MLSTEMVITVAFRIVYFFYECSDGKHNFNLCFAVRPVLVTGRIAVHVEEESFECTVVKAHVNVGGYCDGRGSNACVLCNVDVYQFLHVNLLYFFLYADEYAFLLHFTVA